MSFLLLKKSSSRSSGRTLNSFHHGKHNVSTRKPPQTSSRNHQSLSDDSRCFSSNVRSLRHETMIDSGSGEMQIQRLSTTTTTDTTRQQERDQGIANKQQHQQQQLGNAQNDVISMDEGK